MYVERSQIPVFDNLGELGAEGDLPIVDVEPASNRLLPRGTHLIVAGGSKFYPPGLPYTYTSYSAVEVILQMDTTVRVREDQSGLVELDAGAEVAPAVAFKSVSSSGHERTLSPSETYQLLPGTDVTIVEASLPTPPSPPVTPGEVISVATPWYKRPRTYVAAGALLIVGTVLVLLARRRG